MANIEFYYKKLIMKQEKIEVDKNSLLIQMHSISF